MTQTQDRNAQSLFVKTGYWHDIQSNAIIKEKLHSTTFLNQLAGNSTSQNGTTLNEATIENDTAKVNKILQEQKDELGKYTYVQTITGNKRNVSETEE